MRDHWLEEVLGLSDLPYLFRLLLISQLLYEHTSLEALILSASKSVELKHNTSMYHGH